MADDILTRNAAGELTVRTTQTTGDTGTNKDDVYTRDSQGRLAVRTTGNGGGGGADYSAEIRALENAVSVLATSANLSTEIGGTTTVALSELTAMDIDGRPSYKQAGATVYSENGVVGIIDTVDSTNAVITTVSTSASVSEEEFVNEQVVQVRYDIPEKNPYGFVLGLGKLEDGEYSFCVKAKRKGNTNNMWGQLPDEAPWLNSRVVFTVKNGEYAGRVEWLPPIQSYSNFGGWTQSGGGQLLKNQAGELFFYTGSSLYGEGQYFTTDFTAYVDESYDFGNGRIGTGEYDFVAWKFTDLTNEQTKTKTKISMSAFGGPNRLSNYIWSMEGGFDFVCPVYGDNILNLPATTWNTCLVGNGEYFETPAQAIKISNYYVSNPNGPLNRFDYSKNSFLDVLLITEDKNSFVRIKIDFTLPVVSARIVGEQGVLKGLNWYVATDSDNNNESCAIAVCTDNLPTAAYSISVNFYGKNQPSDTFVYFQPAEWNPHKICDVERLVKPTEDSSGYTLYHDNGLIEMGGIVPITDTLQPDVALGNVPVVFPQELANANFVPTITVMTDGTFKRVMADVANPTTTGFDLCVRNVDTEAVSGIKVAWKVVGTNK